MSDKLREALKDLEHWSRVMGYEIPAGNWRNWENFKFSTDRAEYALRESPAAPEGGEMCTCKRRADLYPDSTAPWDDEKIYDPSCKWIGHHSAQPVASPSLPAKEERCVCGKLKKYHFVSQPLACDVYRPAPAAQSAGGVEQDTRECSKRT
jgi:hypothetical protein